MKELSFYDLKDLNQLPSGFGVEHRWTKIHLGTSIFKGISLILHFFILFTKIEICTNNFAFLTFRIAGMGKLAARFALVAVAIYIVIVHCESGKSSSSAHMKNILSSIASHL